MYSSIRPGLVPIVCAAVAIAGCKQAAEKPQATMAMAAPTIPAGADYTAADVEFMQGMIGHHSQAIKMAAMAPSHGASPAVALVARRITNSQVDEIATMMTWLKDRKQAVPDTANPHPMMMPGMLTDAQMKELDQAKDTTFDRLFLTDMIQHHTGALKMVKDLFATPGAGQASEVFQYATNVDVDQRAEIDRMEGMLNTTQGSSAR